MIETFKSQVKAQAFVRSLVKKGYEPGKDFRLETVTNLLTKEVTYKVEIFRKLGIFGA